jgi:hypothetical protein
MAERERRVAAEFEAARLKQAEHNKQVSAQSEVKRLGKRAADARLVQVGPTARTAHHGSLTTSGTGCNARRAAGAGDAGDGAGEGGGRGAADGGGAGADF